jgi:hypothetical protein
MNETFTLSVDEYGEIDIDAESFNKFYESAKVEFNNLFNMGMGDNIKGNKWGFKHIIKDIYIREDMKNVIINMENYYDILLIYFFNKKEDDELANFLLEYNNFYLEQSSDISLKEYITSNIEPDIKTIKYENKYNFSPKLIHILATIKYFKTNNRHHLIFTFTSLDKIIDSIDITNFKVDFIKTNTEIKYIASRYFGIELQLHSKFCNIRRFYLIIYRLIPDPINSLMINNVEIKLRKIISYLLETKNEETFNYFIEQVLDHETKQKVLDHFGVKDILKITIYI